MKQLYIEVPKGQARRVFYGDHVLLPYLFRESGLIQAMLNLSMAFFLRFEKIRWGQLQCVDLADHWLALAEGPAQEGGLHFIKMHGAGNDYVFCDGFARSLPSNLSEFAARISDRHFGIGADGLVAMTPPEANSDVSNPQAIDSVDVTMQMWNADGSSGAMCGNAARCVAFWMKRCGRVSDRCRILMGDLLIVADVSAVSLGSTYSDRVSLQLAGPRCGDGMTLDGIQSVKLFSDSLCAVAGLPHGLTCDRIDCGNQHAVIFVHSLSDRLVRTLGPAVENHSAFPDRVNVEFVSVRDRQTLEVRVWERGSGETLACGSGACAAAVAAIRREFCDADAEIEVHLPGGALHVQWHSDLGGRATVDRRQGELILAGPACFEFEGVWMGPCRS